MHLLCFPYCFILPLALFIIPGKIPSSHNLTTLNSSHLSRTESSLNYRMQKSQIKFNFSESFFRAYIQEFILQLNIMVWNSVVPLNFPSALHFRFASLLVTYFAWKQQQSVLSNETAHCAPLTSPLFHPGKCKK